MKRIEWAGHVIRMGKDGVPRRALEGQYGGRRMVGRPLNRWEDMVQEDAVNLLGIRNWKAVVRNRGEWRRTVGEAMAQKQAKVPYLIM